ncbi:hypothetical protein TPHA_0E00490 [Tetrapisispora phaffii CBS 4417]|uniref:Manganese/iron superoxide dismutase C-terminal domain-containing protein n=1 Tax=Tetrapisispora phaffii (strain ATCC 24235 / CBS 4417 / NBRC 1672 / NRRL Y-8282 / UCD 70-5) TaxID=1071381 RepID=G8BTB7_TETPH|nr:mitochondrial 37S ribosomal protein RSM26 TPHA_0E00490 [Tetrapisispora phaffii CBS 4417]CCE63145.1 hypothetical protein TPHA_0E00490 [Tetrapisispora phaffii CBS 4417]
MFHSGLRLSIAKRGMHRVPTLPNYARLVRDGIPKVLSAKAFDIAWKQQQKLNCEKLSLLTSGTSLESYLPFHIILNTSKKQFQTNIFNAASATHNNHLFIENILPTETSVPSEPSRHFLYVVEKSFGCSWVELKKEIIKRAKNDVLGQGWLFLVENNYKEFHILTIQNNGSPYYFPRNQSIDLNNAISLDEYSQLNEIKKIVNEQTSKNGKEKVEDWTMPIICINLCDHAYLHDYGVKGRSEYVKNVLDNLNWNVINARLYSDSNK